MPTATSSSCEQRPLRDCPLSRTCSHPNPFRLAAAVSNSRTPQFSRSIQSLASMRVVLLLLAVTTHLQGKSMGPVSELCMGCLCEASTDCNRNFQCDGRYCGMFRISAPYWRDAGSPVKNGDNTKTVGVFERCVMDPYCAARTVQGYMDRFRKDCNGDNKVDCDDFALLHYQGAGCEDETDKEYEQFWTKLHECLAEVAD